MLEVVPTGAALGAEVQGVDLRRVDDATFAAIHRAWVDHAVLLFRGQSLSDDDLIAFSRRFGPLDWAPVQENGRRFVEGKPELYIVSNVLENGVAIGSLGSGELVWHTDMSYLDDPPKASMLYAIEIPPVGGNTSFCSMYAAWDTLPAALKATLRRAADQARRHLQQRRLSARGRHRDGRSAQQPGRGASAGLPASGERAAGAVSRPAAQRVSGGAGAGGKRGAAGCAVGACRRSGAGLDAGVARRATW